MNLTDLEQVVKLLQRTIKLQAFAGNTKHVRFLNTALSYVNRYIQLQLKLERDKLQN